MSRTTSFVLGQELEHFVHEQVRSGAYSSASEVVRDALERLAIERRKEEALLQALDDGIGSGRAKPGVFNRIRGRVQRKRR